MSGIGTASRLSGVSIETIRYYERTEVVPRPVRTNAGRREYTATDIGRLRFIKRCRDLGFPLPDAQSLLRLAGGPATSCGEAKTIADGQLASVRSKITQLKKMEAALSVLIEQCSVDDATCPMLVELLADD